MAYRPRHGWQARDDSQRCASTETRWVDGSHGDAPRRRTVRCTLPRLHEEICRWRNRDFGPST